MPKLESEFANEFKELLRHRFPDCFILKLDPNNIQGIPDLLVLWHDRWAILETKRGPNSPKQPNQEYYVQLFDAMSFSAFVHPGNYKEVLDEMEREFA